MREFGYAFGSIMKTILAPFVGVALISRGDDGPTRVRAAYEEPQVQTPPLRPLCRLTAQAQGYRAAPLVDQASSKREAASAA